MLFIFSWHIIYIILYYNIYMKVPNSFIPYHPLTNFELMDFMKINNLDGDVMMREEYKGDKTKNKMTILNLDKKQNNGTHWVGVFKDGDKIIYFDPFGNPPCDSVVALKNNNTRLFYADNQIQPQKSILCGYFCCCFLYWMNKGKDLHDFLYQFKMSNEPSNDTLLKKIIEGSEKINNGPWLEKEGKGVDGAVAKPDPPTGKGVDIVEKINKAFPETEFHMFDVSIEDGELEFQKYSFLGPGTQIKEHISNYDQLMDLEDWRDIDYDNIEYNKQPINTIDKYSSKHDLDYSWIEQNISDKDKVLKMKHDADRVLEKSAFDLMKKKDTPLKEKVVSAMTGVIIWSKIKMGLGRSSIDKDLKKAIQLLKKHQTLLSEQQQTRLAAMLIEN